MRPGDEPGIIRGVVADSVLYKSDRRFEVWDLGVGHRGLLLRSNPSPTDPARIEIWFKPAYVVSLPTAFAGLEIEATNEAGTGTPLGRDLKSWEWLYRVKAPEFDGWVIGGSVSGREDDAAWDSPTMFDGLPPRDGVRQLFSHTPANCAGG